jgi:HK97 family phage major capsid protein
MNTLRPRNRVSPGLQAHLAELGVTDLSRIGRPVNNGRGAAVDVEDLTIPDDPTQLEEMLNDAEQRAKIFSSSATADEFIRKYVNKVMNAQQTIAEQVSEYTQAALADWMRENQAENIQRLPLAEQNRRIGTNNLPDKVSVYNPRAMGASIDDLFASSGEFFQTIWHQKERNAKDQSRIAKLRNAFSSTVPSEGGFLIPEQLRAELLRVSLETSIVRPRARVVPMETLRVPFPAIDATSNVSSVYGGIIAYWTEEGAAMTQSAASFARIVLEAKKLTAYTEVPNELVADSLISFEMFLNEIFPEALGFYEDDAFINGSGVGEPLGFLNAASKILFNRGTNNEILYADVVGMYARMLPSSLNRAVWIASPATFPELATMELSTGSGALWIGGGSFPSAASSPPMTLLGRPLIISEKVPTLGSAGDLNLVDFGFYLIGDRQVMSARSSEHYKFQNDVTAYRIISRVDGRPWLQSAITPKNNGATLSPFVSLDA